MSDARVALRDVSKAYGERPALRGISFELRAGEAVGYLGPNGAGKTSTLKVLCGLATADSGSVSILGRDPVRDRSRALAKVGALVETPGLLPFVHGRDLLRHISEVKGVASADRDASVEKASRSLGVAEQLDRPMGQLSTGQARRLLLAGALVGDPSVLLLDEPTLGLDPVAREDLRAVLRELKGDGRTLLLSTHLLEDVEEVCDRVLFLRDGRLVGDEPVRRTLKDAEGRSLTRLHVRLGEGAAASRVGDVAGPSVEARVLGPRDVELTFPGGEAVQADLVARLVRAAVPVTEAFVPPSDLSQRYLELVGREERS